jgi:hypothetical protein
LYYDLPTCKLIYQIDPSSAEHRFSLPSDFRSSSGYRSLTSFDHDSASDTCVGYDRGLSSSFGKTSFANSDYFNKVPILWISDVAEKGIDKLLAKIYI